MAPRIVAIVGAIVGSASADQCSDKACFNDDNNCRNYQQIRDLCGPNAVCQNNALGVAVCHPAGGKLEVSDVCTDKACFNDDNNCRNYQQIRDLCGPNAVCRNNALGVAVCHPAGGELEASDVCTDKACFNDDNNCRNYQQIRDLCGPSAVCRNNALGVAVCHPAGGALEVSDVCSDYACFGDSNNCRNYAKIQQLCGSSAVCRYNPAKGIDTCFTSFADDLTKSGTGDFLAVKDDVPTAGDTCSDYACFGSDANCRNYAKIQQLCGPNAVCQYNSAKGTSVCQPAAVELGAEAGVCTDYACFGDSNNCQNYQDIRTICGPGAVCSFNPAKGIDTCYPR